MATKKEQKKLCFVIGPIGADDSEARIHSDWLLEEIIQPVIAEFPDFDVRRADQISQPGLIDAQIIEALLSAELVIADLTTLNPNAFYEIGIRHMAQMPIIHMHEEGQEIPFDVSLYRSIKFTRVRPRDIRAARVRLRETVDAVLAEDYEVENPVTKARGRVQLQQNATPAQQVLLDQLESINRRLSLLESPFPNRFLPTWTEYVTRRESSLEQPDVGQVIVRLTRDPLVNPGRISELNNYAGQKILELLPSARLIGMGTTGLVFIVSEEVYASPAFNRFMAEVRGVDKAAVFEARFHS